MTQSTGCFANKPHYIINTRRLDQNSVSYFDFYEVFYYYRFMNYKKHYDLLISQAKNRILEGYFEEHHIIPEHFFINRTRKGPKGWLEGNPNDPNNLVLLTPEEHYLAHLLLVKIYPNQLGLLYTLAMMSGKGSKYTIRNNKCFGWVKRKLAISMSKRRKNKPSWNFGIPCRKETKEKLRIARKQQKPTFLGKKQSKESIDKMLKTRIQNGTNIPKKESIEKGINTRKRNGWFKDLQSSKRKMSEKAKLREQKKRENRALEQR